MRRRGRYAGMQFQFSQTEVGMSSSAQQSEANSAAQHSKPSPSSSSAQHDPPFISQMMRYTCRVYIIFHVILFLFYFMYIYDIVTFMYFLQTDPGEYALDADPQ